MGCAEIITTDTCPSLGCTARRHNRGRRRRDLSWAGGSVGNSLASQAPGLGFDPQTLIKEPDVVACTSAGVNPWDVMDSQPADLQSPRSVPGQ